MNTERLQKFIALEKRKIELNTELKKIAEDQARIGEGIMEDFITVGIDNIKMNGRTVYIKKDIYAQIKGGKSAAIDVLKKAGMNDLVTEGYNTSTVNAFVRECIKGDEALPEEFGNVITAGERTKIASVKS